MILFKKINYNAKITELENKFFDISHLATKNLVNKVEKKIPSTSNLVKKKTNYNTKVTEIENKLNNDNHDKYIDTSKFNTLATNLFNTKIAQANLITKTDFDAKLSSLNRKITQNKSKHLLVENELNTLKTIPDLSSLVKKTDYNTKIGEINTKIDKNLLEIAQLFVLLTAGNILVDGEMAVKLI